MLVLDCDFQLMSKGRESIATVFARVRIESVVLFADVHESESTIRNKGGNILIILKEHVYASGACLIVGYLPFLLVCQPIRNIEMQLWGPVAFAAVGNFIWVHAD